MGTIIRSSRVTSFEEFKPWFYAAACYNFLWGLTTIFFPQLLFEIARMAQPNYPMIWQCVGMFVMVFSLPYWWAAREPYRHRHYILIGLLGKILGPIGFVWAFWTSQLPGVFGWTILTNDLIWWPAFISFIHRVAKESGGLMVLLQGD
jgi:hypothetical protein